MSASQVLVHVGTGVDEAEGDLVDGEDLVEEEDSEGGEVS